MHTSQFREDFLQLKRGFEEFKEDIREHNQQNEYLWKKEYLRDAEFEKKIAGINKQLEDTGMDSQYKFSKINQTLTDFDDKLGEVLRKLDHNSTVDKQLQGQLDNLQSDIQQLKSLTDDRFAKSRQALESDLKNLETLIERLRSDQLKRLDASKEATQALIEKVRAESKIWTQEEKDRTMEEVQVLMGTLDTKIEELDKKTKKKANSIQDICRNFFEKLEEEIKTYRTRFAEMTDSYDVCNKNHKKPSDLKEAALYALEARLLNEEHARISEAIVMKDVMNKLIYSLSHHLEATSPFLKSKNFQDFDDYANIRMNLSSAGNDNISIDRKSNSMERDQGKVGTGGNENFSITNKQLHERGKSKEDQGIYQSEVASHMPPHTERNSRRYRQQSSVGPNDEGKYLRQKHED